MITIGIDQSFASTGYVVLEDDDIIKYGIITSNKNDNMYDRAFAVATELAKLCEKYKVDKVVIEGIPFMSKSNVTRDLAGLQYVIVTSLWRYELGDTLHIIPPTALKKFATGTGKHPKVKGKNQKEPMFDALPDEAKAVVGRVPKSKGRYDVCDAYWLAKFDTKEAK